MPKGILFYLLRSYCYFHPNYDYKKQLLDNLISNNNTIYQNYFDKAHLKYMFIVVILRFFHPLLPDYSDASNNTIDISLYCPLFWSL